MQNKYWNYEIGVHELHFTHFYDDEVILKFVQDIDTGTFWYVSDLLNVKDICIFASSIDEAKGKFEEKVEEYIEDQIAYYEEMLEKFKEE